MHLVGKLPKSTPKQWLRKNGLKHRKPSMCLHHEDFQHQVASLCGLMVQSH